MAISMTPHVILRYRLAPDYLERRAALRSGHLELVAAYRADGHLVLAGALTDPADEALLVFATEDTGVAERFARADPYVLEGLVERYEVRGWAVVGGAGEDREGRAD